MALTAAEFLAVDEQAPAKVERDRWQRPLIRPIDPDAAKRPYTRASTLGKALDDEAGLTAWKQRMTAIGVAKRQDLIVAACAHYADKTVMSDIVEQAMDAAEAGAAATSGTALHELMDAYDHGRDPYVPESYRADIAAYREVTAPLEFVRSETFVVDDELEVAGTYDNLWRTRQYMVTPAGTLLEPGALLIGDKKTGAEIRYGHASWSVQLSCYAYGLRYDPATDTRLDPEPINRDWGLIVHAPVMRGTATLYWIDLRKGRQLAHLAHQVRTERKAKTMKPANVAPSWAEVADAAGSLEQLRAVWAAATEAKALDAELKAHMTGRAKELAA